MNSTQEIFPVEVFDGNDWEVSMVKSLLENAEIDAFLKDSKMGVIEPWAVAGGGAGSVKLFVSNVDLDLAKEVIEQYNKAEVKEE